MFGLGPATKIYIAIEGVDMRKGFDGLFGLVRDRLGQDPLSGHLFLFSNRGRNAARRCWCGTAAVCGYAPTNFLHTTPLAVPAQHFWRLSADLLLDPLTDPIGYNVWPGRSSPGPRRVAIRCRCRGAL